MTSKPIFSYSDARTYVLDFFNSKQKDDPSFSIRRWAREMGISHALLLLLMQGRRPLRVKHAGFLGRGLGLSSQETLYLQALIQFGSAQDPEERNLCALWLADLNPGGDFRIKELEEFAVISDCLYTGILSMTDLRGFDGSEAQVVARMRGRVTKTEARLALKRLFDLGLLARDETGRVRSVFQKVTSKNDIIDAGVRKYHQAASELAKEAVETFPPELREFQSFSLAIDKSKLPMAKEMIRKFRSQFAKAMGSASGDEVYQTNIQFFQLTESPAGTAEDEGVETEQSILAM